MVIFLSLVRNLLYTCAGGVVRVGRGNVQDPTDTESEALVATAGATNRTSCSISVHCI